MYLLASSPTLGCFAFVSSQDLHFVSLTHSSLLHWINILYATHPYSIHTDSKNQEEVRNYFQEKLDVSNHSNHLRTKELP